MVKIICFVALFYARWITFVFDSLILIYTLEIVWHTWQALGGWQEMHKDSVLYASFITTPTQCPKKNPLSVVRIIVGSNVKYSSPCQTIVAGCSGSERWRWFHLYPIGLIEYKWETSRNACKTTLQMASWAFTQRDTLPLREPREISFHSSTPLHQSERCNMPIKKPSLTDADSSRDLVPVYPNISFTDPPMPPSINVEKPSTWMHALIVRPRNLLKTSIGPNNSCTSMFWGWRRKIFHFYPRGSVISLSKPTYGVWFGPQISCSNAAIVADCSRSGA